VTAYNGQRCTAVKLMVVHESVYGAFLAKYLGKVGLGASPSSPVGVGGCIIHVFKGADRTPLL
jgi:acyl-CoA reductase-like NAD-dependent aldehyde dehydrogenase